MILDDKLAAGEVIVLDGATGTEISRLGVEMHGAAWCAVANKTNPDAVRAVHESYLRAGADVITTNTFATCRHVLDSAGLGAETVAINRRAVELAREARDNVAPARPVAIAGSMSHMIAPEQGAWDPDPRYAPTPAQEAANFREMAETLAEAGCDLLLMEMMFHLDHAVAAIEAAVATGLPAWIGMSCSRRADGALISYDLSIQHPESSERHARPEMVPLATLIDTLTALGGDAAGIMHSEVADTSPGLETLFERWSGPVMAYPETAQFKSLGEHAPANMEPADFARHCRGWVEDGVQIIGGCCGTTIDHIRAMVDRLPSRPGLRHDP